MGGSATASQKDALAAAVEIMRQGGALSSTILSRYWGSGGPPDWLDSRGHRLLVGLRLLLVLVVTALDTWRHAVCTCCSRRDKEVQARARGKAGRAVSGRGTRRRRHEAGGPENRAENNLNDNDVAVDVAVGLLDNDSRSQDSAPEQDPYDFLGGKVCLLTGVTSGIGAAALRRILELPPSQRPRRLLLLVQNGSRLPVYLTDANRKSGIKQIDYRRFDVDLASPGHVLRVAKMIIREEPELELMMLNAGMWRASANTGEEQHADSEKVDDESDRRLVVCDGSASESRSDNHNEGGFRLLESAGLDGVLEAHFAVNFLANYLLVETLRPCIRLQRVVFTGSFLAFDLASGQVRYDDLQLAALQGRTHFFGSLLPCCCPRRRLAPHALAYSHSKLLLHFYAKWCAESESVAVPEVAVADPGIVDTNLHAALRRSLWTSLWVPGNWVYSLARCLGLLRSPDAGASPLLECLTRRNLVESSSSESSNSSKPMSSGRGAVFCEFGRTYLRPRAPSRRLERFRDSDLLGGSVGEWLRVHGVAPDLCLGNLSDDSMRKADTVFGACEDIRERLEAAVEGETGSLGPESESGIFPVRIVPDPSRSPTIESSEPGPHMNPLQILYLDILGPLSDLLLRCPPGPAGIIQFRHVVNLFKGLTLPFCLFLMWWYGHLDSEDTWVRNGLNTGPSYPAVTNATLTAWTYTALHGGYGLCWLLKDTFFPDAATLGSGSIVGLGVLTVILLGYWYLPVLVIGSKAQGGNGVHPWLCATSVVSCMCGCVLMMVADAHKFLALKMHRQRQSAREKTTKSGAKPESKPFLVCDGVLRRNRNPNYLGEVLVYASFVALTGFRWEAVGIVGSVWLLIFATNMAKKEISLSRKPGGQKYRTESWLFLFRPW